MTKIKIAVAGCLGRMGQELSKKIINNNKLEFVGGFEHKKHKHINKEFNKVSDIQSSNLVHSNPNLSIKLASVLIDFTTPQSTLENIKIASLKGNLKKVKEYPASVHTKIDSIIVPNVTTPLLKNALSIPAVIVVLPDTSFCNLVRISSLKFQVVS